MGVKPACASSRLLSCRQGRQYQPECQHHLHRPQPGWRTGRLDGRVLRPAGCRLRPGSVREHGGTEPAAPGCRGEPQAIPRGQDSDRPRPDSRPRHARLQPGQFPDVAAGQRRHPQFESGNHHPGGRRISVLHVTLYRLRFDRHRADAAHPRRLFRSCRPALPGPAHRLRAERSLPRDDQPAARIAGDGFRQQLVRVYNRHVQH